MALTEKQCREIYDEGHEAGMVAGENVTPTPMVVYEAEALTGKKKPGGQEWFVGEGACGFAWVVVKPGNCKFAKWLKKHNLAGQHYYGGVSTWVSEFGQSIARKERYADAMTKVFKSHGIKAYSGSRLD